MKSIVTINHTIPTAEHYLTYTSGESLRDYDIAVFDPQFPYLERVHFDAGGSCLAIESTNVLAKAMSHWAGEMRSALKQGKTIFIILNEYLSDQGAVGSTTTRNSRNYSTTPLDSYQAIPFKLDVTNAKGKKVVIANSAFHELHSAVKDMVQYRVIVNSPVSEKIYTTRDGATIGAVIKTEQFPGSMVLLPYFAFEGSGLIQEGKSGKQEWTEAALRASNALISQLVAIDKHLRGSAEKTPPPNWVQRMHSPAMIAHLDQSIAALDEQIAALQQQRLEQLESKNSILEFSHLLFENGKTLERAIERALHLLGYSAETLQTSELEIDHVIVGPSGRRMIGESEGKDNSAIDISKFRQLESNIGEDFQRDEVDQPAKGLLFGNGFRLTIPEERPEQFTQKSLTNAKRLGSALIRTADLYPIVVYLLDHPDNDAFRLACRRVIEETVGGIVEFPAVPNEIP